MRYYIADSELQSERERNAICTNQVRSHPSVKFFLLYAERGIPYYAGAKNCGLLRVLLPAAGIVAKKKRKTATLVEKY